MAVVQLDDFVRANQDLGPPGDTIWTNDGVTHNRILSNRGSAPASGFGESFTVLDTDSADSEFIMRDVNFTSGDDHYLYIRMVGGTGGDYYIANFLLGWFQLIRSDSGVWTNLAQGTPANNPATGDDIKVRMVGSTLEAYVDKGSGWVLVDPTASVTDGTYTAAGRVGFSFEGSADAASCDWDPDVGGGGAPTKSWDVQHITSAIGNGGGTQAITPVDSIATAIELNTNNRHSHGGDDLETVSNREGDDMSGTTELTATGILTHTREAGSLSVDMRFQTDVLEYLGPPGGPNELLVRHRGLHTLSGTEATFSLDTAVTDIDNCVVIVNGVRTNATGDDWDDCNVWADLTDVNTGRIRRGSSNNTVQVQVLVLEAPASSDWEVYHGLSASHTADSGSYTLNDQMDGLGSTGDVTDWATAWIVQGQLRGNSNGNVDDSLADTSPVWEPGADTQTVDWSFNANQVASTPKASRVYVLRHPDLKVTRFSSTGNATGNVAVTITSAGLPSVADGTVRSYSNTSGNGTAYGRGWRNAVLVDTDTVNLWCHRSGNTMQHRLEVVDFSALEDTGGDTTPPTPNITVSPSRTVISDEPGFDETVFTFEVDEDCQAYDVRVVPSAGSTHTEGTSIESGGAITASSPVVITITDNELTSAGGVEGNNQIKVFAQDNAGNWSV